MKRFFTFFLILSFATAFAQVEGTWKMSPQAGALGVGPNQGEIYWWSNSEGDITTRACYFDDEFEISSDGTFQNVLQDETWIEGWQGGTDACGTPVYPHDGSIPATWTYDAGAGTLTLNGTGSYLGIPKAYNGGELSDPADAPPSITYLVQMNATNDTMIADIDVGGAWWRFILTTNAVTPPPPDPIYLPVTFNNPGLDYKLTDFGGNWSSIIEDPDDSTNLVVETFRDSGAQTWAGTTVGEPEGLAEPVPFIEDYTTMSMKVYSPEAGIPILLKLEVWDNTSISTEVQVNTTVANDWETLYFDFSNDPNFDLANPYNKPVVFFNFGVSGGDAGEMTFMWDDIEYIYPVPAYTYNDFDDNQNNEFLGDPVSPVIVANPDPTGMNTSDNCMEYLKDQEDWAYVYTELDELINFENGTNFQMKVHSDTMCEITFKLENRYASWISVERTAMITDTSTWVLLNFDFTGAPSETYSKIVIFFGFADTRGYTFYFDDVVGPVYDTPKEYLEENVQDNFENDGWSTIDGWIFQDPDMNPLTTTSDPEDGNNTVADYNRSGSFQYTNAQVELNHILDLTERNKFELMVYFPSSNDYTGDMPATAAIKLQNSLYIENAWWTQEEIVQTVTTFDEWDTLTFDFSSVSDRTDFDKIVVQLGGEGHWVPAQFYFDNLYLKHVPYITVETPNGGEEIEQNSSYNIQWDYDWWDGDIDIELVKEGNDPESIVIGLPASDTTYEWNVFYDQEPSEDYRIIITSQDDAMLTDTSDMYFTILEVEGVQANFTAEPTTLSEGGSVTFTDLSSGGPEIWNWSFEGGIPSTYEGQNPPEIVYETAGSYDVSLSVYNGDNEDIMLKEDYILVEEIIELPAPTNLQAIVGGYDDVQLSWDAQTMTGLEDDFESYEDFVIDFMPWTNIDVDGSTTYGMTDIDWPNAYDPQSFIIFNPSQTTPAVDDIIPHSGDKLAACFAATTPPNNDWLIAPKVNIADGHSLAFWAKSYTDDYGLERFRVGVSTTGMDPADFTIISDGDYVEAPVEDWTEFTYDLSAYAGQDVYVGIQCVSNDAFILLIDDVTIGAAPSRIVYNQPEPVIGKIEKDISFTTLPSPTPSVNKSAKAFVNELLGHNVYRDDVVINTELILGSEYNDPEPPIGSHDYFVTAVYDAGESEPSNVVSVVVTDVNEISKNSVTIYPNPTNGMFTIENVDNSTIDLSLFDITGKEVLNSTITKTSSFDMSAAKKGIYFLRLLHKSSNNLIVKKLIVK